MKKLVLILFLSVFVPIKASAVTISSTFYMESDYNVTLENMWDKMGTQEEKILKIGSKILDANNISKRVSFRYDTNKEVNAYSAMNNKVVTVNRGIMNYIDNDDEMAFILAHEIAHAMDAYGGVVKWTAMTFNGKHYESKADLVGIDYMVKAGYNPVAAIIAANKIFDENQYNFGFWNAHPKGSERMMAMYQYIYLKYPSYLKTSMVNNAYYRIFTRNCARDLAAFKERQMKKKAAGSSVESF